MENSTVAGMKYRARTITIAADIYRRKVLNRPLYM
jgi:hypothetical protein